MSAADQVFLARRIEALDLPSLPPAAVAALAETAAQEIERLRDKPERIRGANEIVAAFGAALAFIHAAETTAESLAALAELAVAEANKAAEAAVAGRRALGWAMIEAGAPSLHFGRYRVDPLAGSARVEIEEAARIPLPYWRRPEPEIDRGKLRRDLLGGASIAGARLVIGSPTVRITAVESTR